MDPVIDRPIFITACPRSGTSLLAELLGIHPQLAWISQFQNALPKRPEVSIINRILNIPVLGDQIYYETIARKYIKFPDWIKKPLRLPTHIFPYPTEPFHFWNMHIAEFSRYSSRSDDEWMESPGSVAVTKKEKIIVRNNVAKISKFCNRKRFFSLYTHFPRVGMIKEIFPDAIFIHLVRDGRAVCESFCRQIPDRNYHEWKGKWSWPEKWPKDWGDLFINFDRDKFAYTAFIWMHYNRLMWRERDEMLSKNKYLEVSYEDLVSNPKLIVKKIESFLELDSSKKTDWYIEKNPPGMNMNMKWKKNIDNKQKSMFEQIVSLDSECKALLSEKFN
jgi:omega-hydroxy-beta-dihydromenaquinone-9 sulfotransferase